MCLCLMRAIRMPSITFWLTLHTNPSLPRPCVSSSYFSTLLLLLHFHPQLLLLQRHPPFHFLFPTPSGILHLLSLRSVSPLARVREPPTRSFVIFMNMKLILLAIGKIGSGMEIHFAAFIFHILAIWDFESAGVYLALFSSVVSYFPRCTLLRLLL